MKSMTGYGSVERLFKEGRLTIELKTLNRRFFELNFKTPREFLFFESKALQELKKNLSAVHLICLFPGNRKMEGPGVMN